LASGVGATHYLLEAGSVGLRFAQSNLRATGSTTVGKTNNGIVAVTLKSGIVAGTVDVIAIVGQVSTEAEIFWYVPLPPDPSPRGRGEYGGTSV